MKADELFVIGMLVLAGACLLVLGVLVGTDIYNHYDPQKAKDFFLALGHVFIFFLPIVSLVAFLVWFVPIGIDKGYTLYYRVRHRKKIKAERGQLERHAKKMAQIRMSLGTDYS